MTEGEMRRMIDGMSKHANMPKPIRLSVCYDSGLQKITGCAEEPVYMGEGSSFVYLLQNIFMAHPEIEKQYPPGALKLLINNTLPKPYSPLFDGDIVSISVSR